MKHLKFNPPCPFETVLFGAYIIPNGAKPNDIFIRTPIEWLVLKKDLQKGQALLVSKYAIDWEGFYETSWNTSYLRNWLNNDFYADCFSSEEKDMIIPVCIAASNGNGKRAIDKVFLLSAEEVKRYFSPDATAVTLEPMVDRISATGKKEDPIEISCYSTIWWTRTSGKTNDMVMCVDHMGALCETDSNSDEIGVRPAVWIKI